jgi:hypothetical protein
MLLFVEVFQLTLMSDYHLVGLRKQHPSALIKVPFLFNLQSKFDFPFELFRLLIAARHTECLCLLLHLENALRGMEPFLMRCTFLDAFTELIKFLLLTVLHLHLKEGGLVLVYLQDQVVPLV